jgi:hypothetical protein
VKLSQLDASQTPNVSEVNEFSDVLPKEFLGKGYIYPSSHPLGALSHLVFKPKPNAHSMCAQESSLHTYRTENG